MPVRPATENTGPSSLAYEAGDWETLAARLAEDVRELRGGDPLKPVTLVVPSVGMKIWLTRELAKHLVVAANIEASYPGRVIGELAGLAGFDPRDYAAYSPGQLTWRLLETLENAETIRNTPLENYLAGDASGMKRVRLARRLAATFDRYLAYRPGMIREWDAREATGPEAARWQSKLWRAATIERDLPVPAHFPAFEAALAKNALRGVEREKLPAAIFLIGIAGMPPAYLRIFKALGTRIPVRVYQTIPSEDFLEDLPKNAEQRARHLLNWEQSDWKNHHPLLMTCGKVAGVLRDRFVDDFENAELLSPLAPAEDDSRLRRLQNALKENDGSADPGEDDGSLVIDSCHGPMREVEVLRDRLLAALDELPGLRPRDILVLSPAMTDYAAYVHAVFGATPKDDPLHLPYSVADKAAADGRPAYALAGALLELPRSRMTASQVVALLESPVTAARMNWTARESDLVRLSIELSGVSWGADLAGRTALAPAASAYGTWDDFLSRLRLGFALGADSGRLFGDVAPLTGMETGRTETLGGLAERVERLLDWNRDSAAPRDVSGWCARFRDEINAWMPVGDDTYADDAKQLRLVLENLANSAEAARYAGEIPYATFAELVSPELEITEDGGRFLTEGVTFAALKPLRSVPSRVIALLGLNAGNFPRRNRPDGFDLMAESPRPGDPDKTAEDRGLFLDCILAARDRLLIVVTGRSASDDEALPLSPVVEELLRAITPEGGDPDNAVTVHPPFPYSPKYHGEDARRKGLFTFDATAAEAAAARLGAQGPAFALYPPEAVPPVPPDYATTTAEVLSAAEPGPVTWRDFTAYFAEFPKYLLKTRLGLDPDIRADEWPEDEQPGEEAAALDRYRLTEALLESPADFRHAEATGLASPSGLGRAKFEEAQTQARKLDAELRKLVAVPDPVTLAFPLTFGPVTIRFEGRFFADPGSGKFVLLRPGKLGGKHRVQAELAALALASRPGATAGAKEELICVGTDNTGPVVFPLPAPEEAKIRLERLVADFLRHRDTPYPLSVEARLALRDISKKIPDGGDLAEMMRPGFGLSDPFAEALWSEAILSSIEDWDEAEILRRAGYEHHVWSTDLNAGK